MLVSGIVWAIDGDFAAGDTDGGGTVTAFDAALLLKMLVSGESFPPEADANGDGKVDLSDVAATLRIAAENEKNASPSDTEEEEEISTLSDLG